jgi:hypothetical protein
MGFGDWLGGKFGGRRRRAFKPLPGGAVSPPFTEVNVRQGGGRREVLCRLQVGAGQRKVWRTGVAIDASGSMQGVFGRGLGDGPRGAPPQTLLEHYREKGWLRSVKVRRRTYPILTEEAKADLVARGHFVWTRNRFEPLARPATASLAAGLDAAGGTTVIYWACGDGKQIELVGELAAEDCEQALFTGPKTVGFGEGTHLTPAVRYFADRFPDAKSGLYVFLTDGELDDLEEVKRHTIQLCEDIAARRRSPLKCVLVGIGDNIDRGQMEALEDLDSPTGIDIWDHKIATDLPSLPEIFAEIVGENQIVAPSARIFDAGGQVVKDFPDSLSAKIRFSMPASSDFFELEVGGQRIKQAVV